jgi:hypothetical protein
MPEISGVLVQSAVIRRGPDFIGIGLQKAGTRWLYNQLEQHPDFWMPPIKELHFFDRPFPHRSFADRAARRAGEVHTAFQQLLESLPRSRIPDFDVYASLFSFAGQKLTGDITPTYCKLSGAEVGAISAHLPQVKILLLLRDPISRFWSNVNDAASRDKLPASALGNAAELEAVLKLEFVASLSYPSRSYKTWASHFPEERLRYFFLDDVIAEPAVTRASILRYLGADPEKKSGNLALTHNSKRGRPRAPLEGAVKEFLIAAFEQELRDCAALFGGPAVGWLTKYGLK